MAEPSVSERILEMFDDLTRNERALAEVLIENPDALVLNSATELSGLVGVSRATTARFFKRLGYPSFRTAQRLARDGERSGRNGAGKRVFSAPLQRKSGRGEIADHLANDVQNLIRSIEAIRSDELREAVEYLARAQKIWVVGFGSYYPLAHFARAQLIKVKADIRMIPIGGFSVPEEFASIAEADTVIALGIARKTRSLRAIMRSAVAAGARVVYITDQASPGAAEAATVTLRCRTQGLALFESVAAPVSILTYLCMAVASRVGQAAIERMQFIDRIHDDWGDGLAADI